MTIGMEQGSSYRIRHAMGGGILLLFQSFHAFSAGQLLSFCGNQSGGFHFQSRNNKLAAAGTSFTWLSSEHFITETYPDPTMAVFPSFGVIKKY